MTRKQQALGVTAATATSCLALLLLLVALVLRASGANGVDLPLVLGAAAAVALLTWLGWRSVTGGHHLAGRR